MRTFKSQDGTIITTWQVGSISFSSCETLDIRSATARDKGKTCICGHVIYVAKRHANCMCGNPRVYFN